MADGRIIIDTEIDSSGAEKDLKGLNNNLSGLAKKGLAVFTGSIVAAGTAIGGLAGIATKYNSQMEDYFANFTVLLGSAEKATKHVEDLKKFAAKTPFEMTGLADASKQLLSFGIDVGDIMPDLQMLGDISLGNQERFKGLALVFAQVASAGKLSGQDLMQFINQGFNPLQIIAEKTGKTMAELKDEMSEGQITYEMVADAMKTATSEGGKFYQGMEVQSKTLSGMWSTLKDDTMSLIGDSFMPFSNVLKDNVMPALQGIVGQMAEAFTDPNIQNSIANIATGMGDLAVKIGEVISEYLPKIIEGFSWVLDNGEQVTGIITALGSAWATWKILSSLATILPVIASAASTLFLELATAPTIMSAIGGIVSALGGPVTLIIGLVSALVAGIVYLWNTNDGFREAIISAWNAIKEAGIACWEWLVNFFTVDIPNAWNSVVEWFSGIPDWFAELWAQVTAKFQEWGNNISNFFTTTIPSWIESISNWFSELPYKIGYALGYVLASIVQWGVDTYDYFAINIPIWIESITNWFSELPDKIWNWLVETYNKVVAWGSNMYNKAVQTAKDFIDGVVAWIKQLPDKIALWFNQTINKVVNFANDAYAKARMAGKNIIDGIVNTIKSLPDKIHNIGVNIVQGLWNGIISMGSWIKNKVNGFFSGLVDGAKAALGIHSPSRVFRDQVGKYMAQGVQVGFEDETDNVKKSMESDLSDLVAKMSATVDYETTMTSVRVAAHNNNLGGGVETDNNTTEEINPRNATVVLNIDGREFMRATAPYQDEYNYYYEGR